MRVITRTCISVALATTLVLAAGCDFAEPTDQASVEQTQKPSQGTVVFDMGHGEVFGAEDTTELGQSGAIERIEAAGFDVVVNDDAITSEDLADAAGLMVAGPMTAFTDQEFVDITAFMQRGGTVLLTIHVPYPVLKVPAHWGLPVGTGIVMSQGPLLDPAQPSVFIADQVAQNEITEGVDRILVVSGWPVDAVSESAQVVVSTGSNAWLSGAGDQQPTPPAGTQLGSYGLIGTARVGEGQIVVSGDDAVFANLALNQADNARLLDNIIRAMSMMKSV